jgi:DNA gyrase inhibitor GyrI
MSEFIIRIQELKPMRVAIFRGYSKTPEMEAHQQAEVFAREKGLIKNNRYQTFGFNKPAPWITKEEEYGYEIWVVVSPEVEIPPYIMEREIPGTKCAVTSIEKLAEIGPAWEYLYKWMEESKEYQHAHLSGLEEVTSPLDTPEEELSFNLYLPVK